ncbi:MAG: putative porin [Chitinophagaceae bacterium]
MNISYLPIILFLCLSLQVISQNPLRRLPGAGSLGNRSGGSPQDSLTHRTGLEDSITISFRYLDSSRYQRFDSSFVDFTQRYPIPNQYIYLGNTGNAARSLLFNPNTATGWDPGFHAYDIYQYRIPETRFYNTTRPYSEIGYLLGSKTEQLIHIVHTQNITPDWNAALQYRLINAPGFYKNQNTNHNSYRLNTNYQSKNRRYHVYFVLVNNKIQSAENGGIRDDEDYLGNLMTYSNRALIPVQLGNFIGNGRNVFSSTINTGTRYKNLTLLLRHQYDIGKKDSIVTDSTVVQLFYPKLRFEHTIRSSSQTYNFSDLPASGQIPDTQFYRRYYGFLQSPASIVIEEKWNELINDLSVYQFPDTKNAAQFIKVGGALQNLRGRFDIGERKLYNIFIHGEYRNKTRNQKWDIEANGQLHLAGYNAGDYSGFVSLKRFVSKNVGYLQAGFQNVNRTPSFVFNSASSFSIGAVPDFNKENITRIFALIEQPHRQLRLTGSYYLITNYTYFKDHYRADQSSALFNLLQVGAEKDFRLSKRWKWHAQVTLQQKAGAAPVNAPLMYTFHRLGYEGNLGFKNLQLLFGTEIKYHTPYKADGYSPLIGQFYYQNAQTINLKMPEVDLYLHFRIKSFTAYIRAENLNTASGREGFGFTNNNLSAPLYPYPGLQIRLGVFWSFVN